MKSKKCLKFFFVKLLIFNETKPQEAIKKRRNSSVEIVKTGIIF